MTYKKLLRARLLVQVLAFLTLASAGTPLLRASIAPRVEAARADRSTVPVGTDGGRQSALRQASRAVRAGRYEEAIAIYSRLIDVDQNDVQARLGHALVNFKKQDYLSCFNEANDLLKSNPENARAHALAGAALLHSGYIVNAATEVKRSLEIDRREPLAWGVAAEIDSYEVRPRLALERARRAHALDPNEPDYLFTIARTSSRLELFTETADAYEEFLRVAPETDSDRREYIQGLIRFYRRLSGAQIHQISGAEVTSAPFVLGDDRRPYIKIKVNGRDATFVIDTGSGFTVLYEDAARRLGVPEIARGGKSQGIGGNGKFGIVYGLARLLQIADVRIASVPCFIRAFHGQSDRAGGEHEDGLIGLSLLSHFLVELDYGRGVLTLNRDTDPAPAVPPTSATVVPFRTTQNGLISIEAQFNDGRSINAILDSAASSTVIAKAAVARLNLGDRIIKGQTATVTGAAGITSDVEVLYITKCQVANLQQANLRALVLDIKAINETSGFEQSGILGGDFLRYFSLTIDFNRARLTFQPNPAAAGLPRLRASCRDTILFPFGG